MTRDDTDETSKFNKLFDIISFDSVRHISQFEFRNEWYDKKKLLISFSQISTSVSMVSLCFQIYVGDRTI